MLELYLINDLKKLKRLVSPFEEFRQRRERALFEKAAKESGVNVTFDQYVSLAERTRTQWEETDLYRSLRPGYEQALDSITFLEGLRSGRSGKDIPEHLRSTVLKALEADRRSYSQVIDRFKHEEQRHRQLSSLSGMIDRLLSEEPIKEPITNQRVMYVAIRTDSASELYVPIDPELAETFIGSLLLLQLDNLGKRLQPYKVFSRYRANPEDVLRTQGGYDFHRLGINLSVVSFMEKLPKTIAQEEISKPSEVVQARQFPRRAQLLDILRRLKRAGTEELAQEMGLKRTSVYLHLNPLVNEGKVSRIKEGGKVYFQLNE